MWAKLVIFWESPECFRVIFEERCSLGETPGSRSPSRRLGEGCSLHRVQTYMRKRWWGKLLETDCKVAGDRLEIPYTLGGAT